MKQALAILFLSVETVLFFLASLVHFGILAQGFEHTKAGTAEAVIGAVLLIALLWTLSRRTLSMAALVAQGFALLGTLVGVTMIAIGVGPQTTGDIVFHMLLIVFLVTGLIMTMREIKRRA